MNLDIYFKPIGKLEIKNNSIGSFCELYEDNFPNWEEADIVVLSVEQQQNFSDRRAHLGYICIYKCSGKIWKK